MGVDVVDASAIPADWVEKEKKIEAQSEDLQGKPENIVEKIVTGRVEKAIKTKLLMAQPYIRDTDQSVEDMVKGTLPSWARTSRWRASSASTSARWPRRSPRRTSPRRWRR